MPVVDVTAHQAEEDVEAVGARATDPRGPADAAAQVPLADEPGAIAGILQDPRQRRAADRQTARAFGPERGFNRPALRVASADQRRTRRAAEDAVRIGVGQPHAVTRQAIQVGRSDVGPTVASEIRVAHVVRHDQNHVGTRGRGGRRPLLPQRQGNREQHEPAAQQHHATEASRHRHLRVSVRATSQSRRRSFHESTGNPRADMPNPALTWS